MSSCARTTADTSHLRSLFGFELNDPADAPLLVSAPISPPNGRSLMPIKPPRPPPRPEVSMDAKMSILKRGYLVFSMHELQSPFKPFQNYTYCPPREARYYDTVFQLSVELAAFVTAIHTHVNLQGRTWEDAETLDTKLSGYFRHVYWYPGLAKCPPTTLAFEMKFVDGVVRLDSLYAYLEIDKKSRRFYTPSFAEFPYRGGEIQAYFPLPKATDDDYGPQIFNPKAEEVRMKWKNRPTGNHCQIAFLASDHYTVEIKTVYGETYDGHDLDSVNMLCINKMFMYACGYDGGAAQVMNRREAREMIDDYFNESWPVDIFVPEMAKKFKTTLSLRASNALSGKQLAMPAPALLRMVGIIP